MITSFCQIRPLLSLFGPREAGIIARQQVQSVYHQYGVAYAIRRECLLEQKSIVGETPGTVVINEPLANVDTLKDFERAESILGESATPVD